MFNEPLQNHCCIEKQCVLTISHALFTKSLEVCAFGDLLVYVCGLYIEDTVVGLGQSFSPL